MMEQESEAMSEPEASAPSREPSRSTSPAPVPDDAVVAITPPRNEATDTETATRENGTLIMSTTPLRRSESQQGRADSPFLGTPMPSRSENDLTEKAEEDVKICPKWSDALRTPSAGEKFSPSKELNKPGSLHGLGLMVATDRAKKLSQTGRRCATLLFDIASLQENFAQTLLKASLQTGASGTPVSKTLVGVNKSRISFAKQLQGLAICVRGSVARPLHGTMASLGETAPSIYQRYAATRVSCVNARQAALRVRVKYAKAVRDAEHAIRELRQARQKATTEPPSDLRTRSGSQDSGDVSISEQSPWERSLRLYGIKYGVSPSRLIARLKVVQSLEAEYRRLVKEENHAVSQAETMEIMALEAEQKLEEERLQFFVESMDRMLKAEKGALDNMVLSAEHEGAEGLPDGSTQGKKPTNDFFKNLLKNTSMEYEEGIGVMEADTLGLPEEVGKLRDEVKSCINSRAQRGEVTKALASILEEVASAASTLAAGLENRMGQEGYNDKSKLRNPDPLVAVMRRNEGPHVGKHWDAIIGSIDDTAGSARQLAQELRVLCQEKLDAFLLRVEKDCRNASESDDQRWKLLGDTARTETKAQMRYQQATSQFEKARERVKSVDSEMAKSEHSEGKGKRMNSGVSKALGNVFSILPDGGEQAMQKMLNADARRQIVEKNLKEADLRENKEKSVLESAILAKAQSVKTYTASAEHLVYTFKKEDEAGWADIETTLRSLLASLESFRANRYNSVERTTGAAANTEDQVSDMAEWTARAKTHVTKKGEKIDDPNADPKVDRGFSLKVELEESGLVYKLLSLDESDLEGEPELGEGSTETESSISSEEVAASKGDDLLDSPTENAFPRFVRKLSASEADELSIPVPKDGTSSGESPEVDGSHSPEQKTEISQSLSSDAAETSVFLAHFWADREEGEEPPAIIESFSCAYWPKEGEGHLSPLLHGRLFLTSNTMYFVGWGDKKIVLNLEDVVSVSKEKNLMGTIDNSLRVVYDGDSGESSYFFGSFAFRDNAYHLLHRLSLVARSLRELNGPPKADKSALPDVPPDEVLKKMDVVLSKKMKNVSIKRFYELIWAEGEGGVDEKPFYGPCLVDMGSHKVNVGKWEFAENGDSFMNQWCGEKYGQRRVISFEFTRTTHLYVGPPVAGVKQTHDCSVEGNDKCVLAMTVEMDGIPYADCFTVEVRWVARRTGAQDLQVDVGVFVDFKKSTMFASKIRNGTVSETKPIHHKLFERAKAVCLEAEGVEISEVEEEEEVEVEIEKPKGTVIDTLVSWMNALVNEVSDETKLRVLAGLVGFFVLRFMFSSRAGPVASADDVAALGQRIDELQDEMKEIRKTLEAILQVMKGGNQA